MKISNTSNRLILSQSHEKCNDSLVRTPYAKSICIFGKSINLNRHALLDTCTSYLYILVGHRVMVGLNICVGVIIPWGSCSQMEVFPNYKTDP